MGCWTKPPRVAPCMPEPARICMELHRIAFGTARRSAPAARTSNLVVNGLELELDSCLGDEKPRGERKDEAALIERK